MVKITVVIPNYNGEKYLIPCLKALYENTAEDMNVIVVDNGSQDNCISSAREQFPAVKYILLDKNYGFCRAVNEGIRAADTPYVILLNNDTEVRRGFVHSLLRRIESHDNIFSVEAKMLQYDDPGKIDSAGTFYNALGWAFARGKDDSAEKYGRPCRTFAACGGAAIYRKKILDEIGLFDEKHFAYLEDIDIGYRARIHGYVNCYEPKAEVIHVGSASSGSRYNEFKVRYSSRNNVYLVYKNMPVLQIILNLPFLAAGFAVKCAFFWKKGFGHIYVNGIREGIGLCREGGKVPFKTENIINYIRIQLDLWRNLFRKR